MHRAIYLLILLLGLAFCLPVGNALANGPRPPDTQALIDAESERKNAMVRLVNRKIHPPAPPLPAVSPVEACGQPHGRVVGVATNEQLVAALQDAQAGDQIRLADGVYRGAFHIAASGSVAAPITLCGSRAAILDAGSQLHDYGLHLEASHWVLAGFTIRNALKGLVTDKASHNVLRSLEVHTTGHEAIHLRSGSSDNLVEGVWIHDTGLLNAFFGEGIYIGSAVNNWQLHSNGGPDTSDRNRVVGCVLGPNITAEGVDIKEGTSDGEVHDSIFITKAYRAAKSWVDLKGNGYRISNLIGITPKGGGFKQPVTVHTVAAGWGERNDVRDLHAQPAHDNEGEPFRASYANRLPATILLTARSLPYTLAELRVRFPASLVAQEAGVLLLREHLFAGSNTVLTLDAANFHELRLLSEPSQFTSIIGQLNHITITGSQERPLTITSWQSDGQPDRADRDGRAYVFISGGRMDVSFAIMEHLGFGMGRTSGVAWYGAQNPKIKALGTVTNSRFEGNFFGVYTFESEGMRWIDNVFANNLGYGFDPHNFSNNFLVEGNDAYGNGSHGFMLSRGCDNNILRHNRSFNNKGHGFMIDDGKVTDGGAPGHQRAILSSHNIIEDNQVWGNQVGVAVEGGADNVVRNNKMDNNRYGVRISDGATGSEVSGNIIHASAQFGVLVYERSTRTHIANNTIALARSAIVLHGGQSIVEGNTITLIAGRGIVLAGNQNGTLVRKNSIAVRGPSAIDTLGAQGITPASIADNTTSASVSTAYQPQPFTLSGFVAQHPAILFWTMVFGLPLLMWLPSRLTRWGAPQRRSTVASSSDD